MAALKSRIERMEAKQPSPDHYRINEIHHHIINPDGTLALNDDGTPMVIEIAVPYAALQAR